MHFGEETLGADANSGDGSIPFKKSSETTILSSLKSVLFSIVHRPEESRSLYAE